MKKLFPLVVAAILSISATSPSCEKLEDEEMPNYFTYDGITYEITGGAFDGNGIYYQENIMTSEYDLYLYTGSMDVDGHGKWSGKGSYINIWYLYVDGEMNEIQTGTYNHALKEGQYTFQNAKIGVNFNGEASEFVYGGEKENVSGTVTVKRSKGKYVITFSVMIDGKLAEGYYKGTLHYI